VGIRIAQLPPVSGLSPSALLAVSQGGVTFSVPVSVVSQGLNVLGAARVSSTENLTLSGEQTIDGVLTSTDRVLVRHQTDPAENGIYLTDAGAWTRATDADTWDELFGAFVFIQEGTEWANSGWVSTIEAEGTLGVDAITWEQFSGAGNFTAGDGLDLTGTVFSLEPIAANSVLANATGAPAVPVELELGTNTFLGRIGGALGAQPMVAAVFAFAALTLGDGNTVVKVDAGGTAIEYGKITADNIDPSAAIDLSQLEPIAALSVVANATNAPAVPTAVAAASDHQVFRRSGTALAFGAVNLASSNAVTGLLPLANITGGSAVGQVLRNASGNVPEWGAVNLADSDAVTGLLPFANIANGSNSGALLYWNGSAWTETGTSVETTGSALQLGTTPATAGLLRIGNLQGGIQFKTASSTVRALEADGTVLRIGDTVATGIQLEVGSGGDFRLYANSGEEYRLSATTFLGFQNSLTDWSFLSTGADPAGSGGGVRLSAGDGIYIKLANTNTVPIAIQSSSALVFGANDAALTSMIHGVGTGGTFAWTIAGSTEYSLSATTFDGQQNTLTDWASISLGATPATSGAVRLTNNESVNFRSSGGTTVWGIGMSSTDRIAIGSSSAAILAIDLVVGTGGSITFNTAAGEAGRITATDFRLPLGGTAATTGNVRLSNDHTIVFRNGANDGNVHALLVSTTNQLVLGLNTAAPAQIVYNVATSGTHEWRVNNAAEMVLSSTTLDGNQNTLTDWARIDLGAGTVATGGLINTPANTPIIRARENGGSAGSVSILDWSSGNNIIIGQSTVVPLIDLQTASGGVVWVSVNGTVEYSFSATTLDGQQNSLTDWSFIALGADPATGGTIRLSQGNSIQGRNFADDGDRLIITWGGSDNRIFFGNTNVDSMRFDVQSGSIYSFYINNVAEYVWDASLFTLAAGNHIALGGDAAGSSGTGDVRFSRNSRITARLFNGDVAGGASTNVITMFSDASNIITIGQSTSVGGIDLSTSAATNVRINHAGSVEYTFDATAATFAANNLSFTTGVIQFNSSSTVAHINTGHNVLFWRAANSAASANRTLLAWGSSANNALDIGTGTDSLALNLHVATGGVISLLVNSAAEYTFSSTSFSLTDNSLTWQNNLSTPTIQQAIDTSATSATVRTTTIAAQDKSGTTSVTAGTLLLRGGDATGGSGTRNGGALDIRAGTGASSNGTLRILDGSTARVEVDGDGIGFLGTAPRDVATITGNATTLNGLAAIVEQISNALNNNTGFGFLDDDAVTWEA
jgi:hypothetical protein